MIQLLFTVLGAEAGVVVLLLVKTPLRRLVLLALDRLTRGRGPVAARTVAATVFLLLLLLASSVHSMSKIQGSAGGEDGPIGLSPTDQVLWSRHLLEASLMGYCLFLALVIDRMHHYIRELRVLRKSLEAVTKQNRMVEEGHNGASKELKAQRAGLGATLRLPHCDMEVTGSNPETASLLCRGKTAYIVPPQTPQWGSLVHWVHPLELKAREQENIQLRAKIAELALESEARRKEAKTAEANALALRKQSEGFLLEYDRLLEDNQNLRTQLQLIDRQLSRSDSKKNT